MNKELLRIALLVKVSPELALAKMFEMVNNENIETQKELRSKMELEKSELLKNFQDIIIEIRKNANSEMDKIIDFNIEKLKSDNWVGFEGLKTEILNLISSQTNELTSNYNKKIKEVDKKIREVKDGKDADEIQIIQNVIKQIKLPEQKDVILDNAGQIRDKLETLKDDDRLDKSAIKGLDEWLDKEVGKVSKSSGRVGWGAHPLVIQQSGTTKVKVARTINFTGATVTQNADGSTTVAITGGTGFTKETPGGAVDSSNTSYTVTAEPVYLIVDGITMFDGAGYSYAALTVTLDNPASQYIRSFY